MNTTVKKLFLSIGILTLASHTMNTQSLQASTWKERCYNAVHKVIQTPFSVAGWALTSKERCYNAVHKVIQTPFSVAGWALTSPAYLLAFVTVKTSDGIRALIRNIPTKTGIMVILVGTIMYLYCQECMKNNDNNCIKNDGNNAERLKTLSMLIYKALQEYAQKIMGWSKENISAQGLEAFYNKMTWPNFVHLFNYIRTSLACTLSPELKNVKTCLDVIKIAKTQWVSNTAKIANELQISENIVKQCLQ